MIVLYVIFTLLGVLVIIGLFKDKSLVLTETIQIQSERETVFSFLNRLENHGRFNAWSLMDPNMDKTYSGTEGEVGSSYHWKSNLKNVGEGIQTLKEIVPQERLTYTIQFIKPMSDTADAVFVLNDCGGGITEVSWSFVGQMKFPMVLFKGVFVKMLKKDLAKGLQTLKTILDK